MTPFIHRPLVPLAGALAVAALTPAPARALGGPVSFPDAAPRIAPDDLPHPVPADGGGQREAVFDEDHPEVAPPRREAVLDQDHPGAAPPRRETPLDAPRARVLPNPSSGIVTVRSPSPRIAVEVYDVAGRRIATFAGSSGEAAWDGRDRTGWRVPPGIYFALVRGARGAVETVRIVRR